MNHDNITSMEQLMKLPKEFLASIIQAQQRSMQQTFSDLTALTQNRIDDAASWNRYVEQQANSPE